MSLLKLVNDTTTPAATTVKTGSLRKIARWGRKCSNYYKSWLWFAKHTLDSAEGFRLYSEDKQLFNTLFVKKNIKTFPKHVCDGSNCNAKQERIRRFIKLQQFFWDITFGKDLSFQIVQDNRFGLDGFKVVARRHLVSGDQVKEDLFGFVEPLDNFTSSSTKPGTENVESAFQKIYCSVITLNDGSVCALYGPLAYVNHDCLSQGIYDERPSYDNIYHCNRNTIELGKANAEAATHIYSKNEEVTIRYVNDITEGLPFDGPCKCSSCENGIVVAQIIY